MAKQRARWDFGGKDLAQLLSEAAQYKGESLWNDAWRRLRANRAAHWSLRFLVLFGLVSALAPLLPLPSPTVIELARESQPPAWAFWAEAREAPSAEREPGASATRTLRAFANNGWRHRSIVTFHVTAGTPDGVAEGLLALVEEASGRRGSVEVRPAKDEVPPSVHVSVPLNTDDAPRVDYEDTGRRGEVATWVTRWKQGASNLFLEFDLPVDLERLTERSLQIVRRKGELHLVPRDDAAGLADLSYAFRLTSSEPARLLGLSINGRLLAANGTDFTPVDDVLGHPLATHLPVAPDELGVEPGELLEQLRASDARSAHIELEVDGQELSLLERNTQTTRERVGRPHDDLGARVARALAEWAPPAGTSVALAGARSENFFWDGQWAPDRAMLWLRGRVFGLWQTGNWMGTDSKGRDILSRIVWGSRTSILVALAATLCSLVIGVTYGALSGYLGGRVDNLMMRLVDILYSVPFIFVVIFLITIVNAYRTELEDDWGIDREVVLYVVIGAIYWLTMARVVRGQVLSLKNTEFIEAARVVGAGTPRILFGHLVPNVLSIVIVYLTLTIPQVMLFEAFLSFLGLGIEEPKVSWGLLASDTTEAISPIRVFWWLVLFPALAMASALLSLNILGDGLRDALDPKLRGKD